MTHSKGGHDGFARSSAVLSICTLPTAPGRRAALRCRLVGLLHGRDRARRAQRKIKLAGSPEVDAEIDLKPRRRLLLPARPPQCQRSGRGPRGRRGAGRSRARYLPLFEGGARQHRGHDQRDLNRSRDHWSEFMTNVTPLRAPDSGQPRRHRSDSSTGSSMKINKLWSPRPSP